MTTADAAPHAGQHDARLLVIGVGHRDREDDAAGPLVVDELRRLHPEVRTVVREGDLAVLPMCWGPDDDVVIVDAVRVTGTDAPDALVDVAPSRIETDAMLSSHGLGLPEALRLAELIGVRPRRLRVVGVPGRRFGHGPPSAELLDALGRHVQTLAARLGLRRRDADSR